MRSPPEEPAEAAQAEVTTAQAEAAAAQQATNSTSYQRDRSGKRCDRAY
ncbi:MULTISPECIES: hypothetical protein [unclassified Coleofasciculus]|nr:MULTISPECIES: hypothetical protein [unclassified Coleofasciculus]MBD1841689.1 hypothetical protein [Coleofasciculus sp. FACHB-501]MBD1894413.1 hypothetical protein [Coleofasciculus sp. FACHB-129]